MERTRRGRVIALDALRAIAALMVFTHHMTFSGIFGPLEPLTLGASGGVFLFFTLSGYLLFEPFLRGPVDLRAYFTHRLLRIMPAYVVALVGLSVLSGDTSFTGAPATYLLFLQNYDQRLFMGFMAPAWTLVLEVVFYLSLPLIAVLLARLRPDAGRPGFASGGRRRALAARRLGNDRRLPRAAGPVAGAPVPVHVLGLRAGHAPGPGCGSPA